MVNVSNGPVTASLDLQGFTPRKRVARVATLAGALDARNTADDPENIKTIFSDWQHGLKEGQATYSFPANSFTVLKFN